MSIELPRSHRPLHFTGSVKALASERPANALGQERPKAPPPPPPSRAIPQRHPVVTRAPAILAPPPATRAPLVSIDEEEIQTQHLDRDEIDAALFPIARRHNASSPAPNLPVPHFRSAAEAQQHHGEPTMIVQRDKGSANAFPLGLWLFAAVIAGIVSFQLAPQARDSVAAAVRALDSRDSR